MEQTPDTPVSPPPARPPHGCLVAFVVALALIPVACLGFTWIAIPIEAFVGASFALSLGKALVFGLILIIPFGAVALFLRDPRFAIWRGVALAVAVGGGHVLIGGILLAFDPLLPYPGLPYWMTPAIVIFYSGVVIAIGRRHFIARPAAGPILLGLALGLAVSLAWLVVGAPGTVLETWLGVLDALAAGLTGAVLIASIFAFDRDLPGRKPLGAALLAGGVYAALGFGLMAVRGYSTQGTYLGVVMIPFGVIAGLLFTLDERPDPARQWWSALAFLFAAFLLPFVWTEGLEGDYMPGEMILAWAPAVPVGLGLGIVLAGVGLALRRPLVRLAGNPALPAVGLMITLALGAVLVVISGAPAAQPQTFFVVMADQADTTFALEIEDYDERRTAVYETLTAHAAETQADLRGFLDERGIRYTPYYLVNGLEVEGGLIVRAQIAARPDVARVINNPHTRPLPESFGGEGLSLPAEEWTGILAWGVDEMNADEVWQEYGVTGEGIVVGHADSGVEWTHPALRDQYLGGDGRHDYTWFDPWYGYEEPSDTIGHGTSTLGTILAPDGTGVAPGARWIACRNLGRNLGNTAWYLACMEFLFAPFPLGGDAFTEGDPTRGAHVVNNSWGCPPDEGCTDDTLALALAHLRNAGQMNVMAAGNDGPGCSTVWSPATGDAGFTVGAVDAGGELAYFSSRGPVTIDGSERIKPDVVAPGVDVYSTSVGGGSSGGISGTSIAAPHVTGLVALLWSADPSLIGDIDRTEQIIIETAQRAAAPDDACGGSRGGPDNAYGYGMIDALAAVRAVLDE